MSAEKHRPQRTCIGCRATAGPDQLLRWVAAERDGGAVVVADPARRASGRGAWLHPTPACAALAVKRRAFPRALRAQVDAASVLDALAAQGLLPAGARPVNTVQPESGSET